MPNNEKYYGKKLSRVKPDSVGEGTGSIFIYVGQRMPHQQQLEENEGAGLADMRELSRTEGRDTAKVQRWEHACIVGETARDWYSGLNVYVP